MGEPIPLPSAGWYADPQTTGQLRWWSGTAWTTHLAPMPSPSPRDVDAVVDQALQLRFDRKRVHGHDMLYVRTADGARVGSLNVGSGKVTFIDGELAEAARAMIEQWCGEHADEATSADDHAVDTAEPKPIDVGVPGDKLHFKDRREVPVHGRPMLNIPPE